jgi:2-oxoglutarate ferredoxin oxidoreductase subunit gamma
MSKAIKIALAGEGGQGVQSIANIMVEAAHQQGREALYIPNFGVEQRGGVSIAYCQISDEPIGSPKFKTADLVVALSSRAVGRTHQYVDGNTVFLYDSSIEGIDEELPTQAKSIFKIPALDIAKEKFHPRVFNVIIMGAAIEATKIVPMDRAKQALENKLGYKFAQDPSLRDMNFQALEEGARVMAETMKTLAAKEG